MYKAAQAKSPEAGAGPGGRRTGRARGLVLVTGGNGSGQKKDEA